MIGVGIDVYKAKSTVAAIADTGDLNMFKTKLTN